MNKKQFKNYILGMLLLKPMDICKLTDGEYKDKQIQNIYNNLKQETKELIETYALGFFYHTIASIRFSSIFETINDYELTENDDYDYVDENGNVVFSAYDTLDTNLDNVIDIIVKYEFHE